MYFASFFFVSLRNLFIIIEQIMNNEAHLQSIPEEKETPIFHKNEFHEFALTSDQYIIIQHFLPKENPTQRQNQHPQNSRSRGIFDLSKNLSRISGTEVDHAEKSQSRVKRQKLKKTQTPDPVQVSKNSENNISEKQMLDNELAECQKILTALKKNFNSYPFLEPVDPVKTGASDYYDVIKEPMDFSLIEQNLKTGVYESMGQFHADVNKIWINSYTYNNVNSRIYKMTVDLEKYYKKLLRKDDKKAGKHENQKVKEKKKEDEEKRKFVKEDEEEKRQIVEDEFQMDFDE